MKRKKTNRTVIGIDLGNKMGVCYQTPNLFIAKTINKVTTKNILSHIDNIVKEIGHSNVVFYMALPQIRGNRYYNVIVNQSKQCGVIESKYDVEIHKESEVNKAITGKGRLKKEETLEFINNKLGLKLTDFDTADAVKFYLHGNLCEQQT